MIWKKQPVETQIATLNSKVEFQSGESYSLTGLYAIAKSNSSGTSIKAVFPTPKGVKSALTISNNLQINALRKYDGTSALTGATVSSATRENYGNLAVTIAGTFDAHTLYYIELAGAVSFTE